MSEPYIGEIRMFGGNFPPRGWQFCQGQILAISSNTALFSILGTTYGGNGTTTFALPNLCGRVAVGTGTGPGLPPVAQGQVGGTPTVNILTANLPPHTHAATFEPTMGTPLAVSVAVANVPAPASDPTDGILAQSQVPARTNPTVVNSYAAADAKTGSLGGVTVSGHGQVQVGATGGGLPLENMPPYLGINYIIAVQGIYPSRN